MNKRTYRHYPLVSTPLVVPVMKIHVIDAVIVIVLPVLAMYTSIFLFILDLLWLEWIFVTSTFVVSIFLYILARKLYKRGEKEAVLIKYIKFFLTDSVLRGR